MSASQYMEIIRMPRLLTVGWSNEILRLRDQAVQYPGPVTFDFSEVAWAAPFGLTAVSVTIERCLAGKKQLFYRPPKNSKVKKYLKKIGFDQIFLRGKRGPNHFSTSVELKRLATVDPGYADALVKLIDLLFSLSEDDEFQLRLHINELMTNAFDHSKSPMGFYACAQWYRQNRNLRVSFADGGIGILETLNQSKKYGRFADHADAIKKAVEPGVTTRVGRGGGWGLSYIRNYVKRNRGVLTIISGDSKVNFYYNKAETRKHKSSFQGTIVDIRIKPGKKLLQPGAAAKEPIF